MGLVVKECSQIPSTLLASLVLLPTLTTSKSYSRDDPSSMWILFALPSILTTRFSMYSALHQAASGLS